MNLIPKRLKQEPLIEAIWQIQFGIANGTPIVDILPGILFSALRVDHPKLQLQRLPSADIPAQMVQVDPNLSHIAKYRLEEPDSPFIFQIGDRIITLNCRRPYVGWTAFRTKILALLKIIHESGIVPAPTRQSLRYIDFLTLEPVPNLSYLQVSLKLGELDILGLPMQTRVELSDDLCTHIVQVATPAQVQFPEGIKEGAIVDLETFPTTSCRDWDTIALQIDHLHDRSKTLFFRNILTAKAIEKMEPEY